MDLKSILIGIVIGLCFLYVGLSQGRVLLTVIYAAIALFAFSIVGYGVVDHFRDDGRAY